jgi:hypothetical protein
MMEEHFSLQDADKAPNPLEKALSWWTGDGSYCQHADHDPYFYVTKMMKHKVASCVLEG